MEDLISRQAAIDALKSAKGKDPFGRYDLQNIGLDWGVSAIEKLPYVQPKRGRWETVEGWDGDELYRCSECGTVYTLIDGTPKDNEYFFCPSCGAEMSEGGQDEQN